MSIELEKLCPFCGCGMKDSDEWEFEHRGKSVSVCCPECGACGPVAMIWEGKDFLDKAKEKWNTRF